MYRNSHIFSLLVVALALGGCSSTPPAGEAKKAGPPIIKIQGKVDAVIDPPGTGDAGLNPGGPSLYIWEGKHRYRLFPKKTTVLENGREYIVEGVVAQKVIDEIGDPANGKNGYPLLASCERAVKMTWGSMSFEEADVKASVLRTRTARYPARPILLVTKIQPVTTEGKKEAEEPEIPTVSVPADKQRALLVEGSPVQTAPLWEPAGGTIRCKVIINREGKISELETGAQLCEAVEWSKFRYQPPVKAGHPVEVRTEVEVRFEARK